MRKPDETQADPESSSQEPSDEADDIPSYVGGKLSKGMDYLSRGSQDCALRVVFPAYAGLASGILYGFRRNCRSPELPPTPDTWVLRSMGKSKVLQVALQELAERRKSALEFDEIAQ